MRPLQLLLCISASALSLVFTPRISKADPTPEQMINITPVMQGIELSVPSPGELATHTVKRIERENVAGWLLLDKDSVPVRRFVDTNGDRNLDRWIYYRKGVEVFRDVDTDFDGSADKGVFSYPLPREGSGGSVAEQNNATEPPPAGASTETPSVVARLAKAGVDLDRAKVVQFPQDGSLPEGWQQLELNGRSYFLIPKEVFFSVNAEGH